MLKRKERVGKGRGRGGTMRRCEEVGRRSVEVDLWRYREVLPQPESIGAYDEHCAIGLRAVNERNLESVFACSRLLCVLSWVNMRRSLAKQMLQPQT